MGKRFTDTDIWKQRWFRILKPSYKELWRYLCENCNMAGVWEIDIEQASFSINENIDFEDFLNVINSDKYRIHLLPKNKLWITGFVEFQQGTLSEDCRPHKVIIELLKSENLWDNDNHSFIKIDRESIELNESPDRVSKGYAIPLTKGMGKGSSNSKSNSNSISNIISSNKELKEKEIKNKEKETAPASQNDVSENNFGNMPNIQQQQDLFADTPETISKTETVEKPKKEKAEKPPYEEIINYLNEKSGKKFRPQSKPTQEAINGRFSEGFTIADFKHVIDVKSEQWRNDAQMNKYLCPETLFRPSHFEKYLNEVSETELALQDEFTNFREIQVPADFMSDGKSTLDEMRKEFESRMAEKGISKEELDEMRKESCR